MNSAYSIFKRPILIDKDEPFLESCFVGFQAQVHYTLNLAQEINLSRIQRQLIADKGSFDGGPAHAHMGRGMNEVWYDVSPGSWPNLDRLAINPATTFRAALVKQRQLWIKDDTRKLKANGDIPNATGVGAPCFLAATAKHINITIGMAVVEYPFVKNGLILMYLQIGAKTTEWQTDSQSTELIMMVIMSHQIADGLRGPRKDKTNQTSNGSSLKACDLRSGTGPSASELQRVLYGTGLNIGLLNKRSLLHHNRGRKCNRCFSVEKSTGFMETVFPSGSAQINGTNDTIQLDRKTDCFEKGVLMRFDPNGQHRKPVSRVDSAGPFIKAVCGTQTKQGGCLYEQLDSQIMRLIRQDRNLRVLIHRTLRSGVLPNILRRIWQKPGIGPMAVRKSSPTKGTVERKGTHTQ